jgi:replicative DNA helicase
MSVPIAALKSGMLTHDEAERSIEFSKLFCSSPLHFVDGLRGMCGGELTSVVRRAVRKHGIKLVIVDYLQKIKPSSKHEKRTYEVAEVSQKLKAIASDMNISVVALAQLSRDNEKLGRTPMPSDLADSSQIERDADVILLIYHEKQEDGSRVPKLILAKQRDGDVGLINVQFSKQFARFESVTYRQEEE